MLVRAGSNLESLVAHDALHLYAHELHLSLNERSLEHDYSAAMYGHAKTALFYKKSHQIRTMMTSTMRTQAHHGKPPPPRFGSTGIFDIQKLPPY